MVKNGQFPKSSESKIDPGYWILRPFRRFPIVHPTPQRPKGETNMLDLGKMSSKNRSENLMVARSIEPIGCVASRRGLNAENRVELDVVAVRSEKTICRMISSGDVPEYDADVYLDYKVCSNCQNGSKREIQW